MIYFPNTKDEKSWGTALGEILGGLAHGKAHQLQKRREYENNEEALKGAGYTPEEAKKLARFDSQILKQVIKNKGKEPSAEYTRVLDELNASNTSQKNNTQSALERFEQPQNQSGQQPDIGQFLQQQQTNGASSPLQLGQLMQQFGSQGDQSNKQTPLQQQSPNSQFTQPNVAQEETRIDWSKLKPEEKKELYKLQQDKRKADEEIARNRFKDTKEVRKDILAKGAQARDNLESLDRLEDLNKNGNLNSNEYIEFLKGVGLDIPAMMTADTQEFNKITANFIRGAKAIFGSRVTEKELEYYLQTIPQISNSPEGRQRVILNLKKLARGEREILNTYKEILRENGGIPPHDTAEQVEERSEKKLDAIAKQFKKELENPFPKKSNSLSVSASSLAGKAVGRIPAAAVGAGAGALAGSRLGVVGAIPGAIIGGLAGLAGYGLPKIGI